MESQEINDRLFELEERIASIDTKLTQVVDAILGNPLTKTGGFINDIQTLKIKMEELEDFEEFGEIEEDEDYYNNSSDENEYEQQLIFGKEETIGNNYFNGRDFISEYDNELLTLKENKNTSNTVIWLVK